MTIKRNALIIAAAFISTTVNAETLLYGVLMQSLSNPYWQSMERGLKEGTENAEVDYYLQAIESNDAMLQLKACNLMLERKPNVMIISALDSAVLLPCLIEADDLNIPVINLDGTLDHHIEENTRVEIAASIATDNEEAGAQVAEHLANQLGIDTTGAVLLIEGSSNRASQSRISGFTERLAKTAPDLEIVASEPGDWDRYSAANVVNKALANNTQGDDAHLKAIFAINDDIALGATDAAFAAGKGDDVIVVGIDGSANAVKSITANRLNASVARFPYLIGKQAIEVASKLLEGESVERFSSVPTMIISKNLLDEGTHQMLEYLK